MTPHSHLHLIILLLVLVIGPTCDGKTALAVSSNPGSLRIEWGGAAGHKGLDQMDNLHHLLSCEFGGFGAQRIDLIDETKLGRI